MVTEKSKNTISKKYLARIVMCDNELKKKKKKSVKWFSVKMVLLLLLLQGTAVSQCLRCCATNRKVAGSIPVGIIGIFY